jgi:hypothetical protein
MDWVSYVARVVYMRNLYKIVVGKPEGRRTLERPTRRWEDNIKMNIKEIGWELVDSIRLAQDRDHWRALVNTVMKILVT